MLLHTAKLKYALRGPHGMAQLIGVPRSKLGVRGLCARMSSPAPALPWRLLEPFKNPKVDLVSAMRGGWKPLQGESFASSLKAHVECWRSEGRSAVWLHLPPGLGSYIPHATDLGFTLHHAVGVAGLVLWEEQHSVLAVKDRLRPKWWKFPGGLSEFGEGIPNTAVREVQEETGIEAEFQSVLAFRQLHNMPAFGNSDLYFICRMKPLTFDIDYCREECLDCKWLPLSDLATDPDSTHLSRRMAELALRGLVEGWASVDIALDSLPLEVAPGRATNYQLWHRAL